MDGKVVIIIIYIFQAFDELNQKIKFGAVQSEIRS